MKRHGRQILQAQVKTAAPPRATRFVPLLFAALAALTIGLIAKARAENFSQWPLLVNPFESTGGGGVMIGAYRPVVTGNLCRTDFTVTMPNGGGTFLNEVEFDATPREGGILCDNGRWRAKDGSAQGTTPFRVFIKDGIVRRPPA